MRSFLKSIVTGILCLSFLAAALPPAARAEELPDDPASTEAAQDISSYKLVTDSSGILSIVGLFDGETTWGNINRAGASFTLTYEEGIGSLYFIFGSVVSAYTLTNNDTGETHSCGEKGYLHDFLDLVEIFGTAPTSVSLEFPEKTTINELSVYTPGQVPDRVQKWEEAPEGGVDLILFSTHGDDEQLFFAGLLPYYAGEMDYEVLVVYLTDHHNYSGVGRMHEMLDGLWAVGVTNYPVFGRFIDYRSEYKDTVYLMFAQQGYGREDVLEYVTEQIRRYKPQVVVGHDFDGEYRHAQHMIYAEVLAEAVDNAMNPDFYPEIAKTYGVWDVPKAYFHLYGENPVVMDWDQPLEHFDGMTAFQVTQELGFPCHKSQQNTWFTRWLTGYGTITRADQIEDYNPCFYGLYRSTVGADVEKNDFFENLHSYAQQAAIAEQARLEEEARREEEERLAEEERQEAQTQPGTEPQPTEEGSSQPPSVSDETPQASGTSETPSEKSISREAVLVAAGAILALLLAALLLSSEIRRKK